MLMPLIFTSPENSCYIKERKQAILYTHMHFSQLQPQYLERCSTNLLKAILHLLQLSLPPKCLHVLFASPQTVQIWSSGSAFSFLARFIGTFISGPTIFLCIPCGCENDRLLLLLMIMIKMKMETIIMMKVMVSANNLTANNAFCRRHCYGNDETVLRIMMSLMTVTMICWPPIYRR